MGSDDLINFEVIETHKENIQALPSGRSAKALAQLYTPPLSSRAGQTLSPSQLQDAHSEKRQEFEQELQAIDDSDDPLDVYDRYVKWTLDAYPSAQNTPQSQLCPLLERATKAFQSSPLYKNDPRYLKLWLHYIRFFSDAPRETFAYLARHNIGDKLALYYEEFAAWLETSGRWTQAEEVYSMGIDKEARPVERLVRKYGEFQHRFESRPQQSAEPSSPALPTVRPALAAKLDPFATEPVDPQAQSRPQMAGGSTRSGKSKLAIFADGDEPPKPGSSGGSKGWDSIGSLTDRKKENATEARSWVGETLKVGKKNTGVPKMMIFKDESTLVNDEDVIPHPVHSEEPPVNPKTGNVEVRFANFQLIYPRADSEYSFEELRARHRGWLNVDWDATRIKEREVDNVTILVDVEQGPTPEESPPILRENNDSSNKIQVHVDQGQTPERAASSLAEGVKETSNKLQIHVDVEQPPSPIGEQRKPSTKLQVHVDEQASPRSSSPAQKAQKKANKAFAVLADDDAGSHRESKREVLKTQTVPLKGIEDEVVFNDENMPPSQLEVEKAKTTKKARRDERSNRTRKIKVMEVKEIRNETQTIQTNLDSPTGRKIRRKKLGKEATMTLHTKEAMDEIYDIFNEPLKEATETTNEIESEEDMSDGDGDGEDDDYTSAGESTGTGHLSCATSEFGDETTAADFTLGTTIGDDDAEESEADETDTKSISAWSEFTESKHVPQERRRSESDEEVDGSDDGSDDESLSEVSHSQDHAEDSGEGLVTPTSPELPSQSLPTRFVPVPPENFNAPTGPYRDPALAANNRLPFMTPIVEKTESSLGIATAHAQKDYFAAKTPSRSKGTPAIIEDGDEPWSSPLQESLVSTTDSPAKVTKLTLRETKPVEEPLGEVKPTVLVKKDGGVKETKPKGPIIQDIQCNPVDEAIREHVLQEIQPPLDSYDGYFADTECTFGKGAEIRKYTKAVSKMSSRTSSDKTATNLTVPPILRFQGSDRMYTVKKELGKGAFAPVYLAESTSIEEEQDENQPIRMGKGEFGVKRHSLEALKMEEPPSPWEFYIMRQAKRRLGVSRPADSVIHAYEMYMFKDECYLVEEFRDQGTLLDLVNIARADNGVLDEQLAMFFTIELFRTVEALHSKGLIHGDLKADNILIRFDTLSKDEQWGCQYKRDGRDGWASKGITLIDFGRGIDMKVFKPDVQFIADWPTTEADCAEMRELRPWTYQIDYHGLAGIVHNLLFGKYISTVAERAATLGAGATKSYRIKESLKRYWQTEIWQEALDLLLNPLMHLEGEEGRKMPVSRGMREVREKMEAWLEANCEKGVGLKALVRRMEEAVKKR
ncbi:checkpoint protein kinase-like protein [Bimuria novae-zelandiae CBS 107.79]|uniref:Checkpoint protein kinase-like protein n=1 Tax=Bimuria novae-zelandiae CBS 107.79 TaxID=1447943 RepID=A0A6A5VRU4_9PLEO|nr:checkpoint protein kinase-like protein [Bimuria novae-zelandiae CBS 107.79]